MTETELMWNKLETLAGSEVRTWSRDKGELKTVFHVLEHDGSRLQIRTGVSTSRTITKSEFERLFSMWRDYCDGKLERKQLQESVNSSYILGMLHRIGA